MSARQFLLCLLSTTTILVTPCGRVTAQEDVVAQLTGGSSREWVFKRIVRSMGPGQACTSGETYTFEALNRALVVRECKTNKIDTIRYTWRLGSAAPGDTAIEIDRMGTFLLLFHDDTDGSHFMRLRSQGQTPTQPTIDKEFRLSED